MKTIATINFKGGVGKTTVTWALGYIAALPKTHRVLLFDMDAQMSLTQAIALNASACGDSHCVARSRLGSRAGRPPPRGSPKISVRRVRAVARVAMPDAVGLPWKPRRCWVCGPLRRSSECALHGARNDSRAAIFAKDRNMNRTDTIKHIALSADLSRDAAGRVMSAFEARLKAHTGAGKRVVLRGFPAQRTTDAVGRAVHQIGRQRGKMLLTQESAWI